MDRLADAGARLDNASNGSLLYCSVPRCTVRAFTPFPSFSVACGRRTEIPGEGGVLTLQRTRTKPEPPPNRVALPSYA
jgi:hypothetical protein